MLSLKSADNVSAIKDSVTNILTTELAAAGLANSILVFKDREDPIDAAAMQLTGHVNVWLSSSSNDSRGTTRTVRQVQNSTYMLECYGYGQSTGNTSGDQQAAENAEGVFSAVRQILMSEKYALLGMDPGVVGGRNIDNIVRIKNRGDDIPGVRFVGFVLELRVKHLEVSSPTDLVETLREISTSIAL